MREFVVLFIAGIRYLSYNLVHSVSLYETYRDFYERLLNILHICQISNLQIHIVWQERIAN